MKSAKQIINTRLIFSTWFLNKQNKASVWFFLLKCRREKRLPFIFRLWVVEIFCKKLALPPDRYRVELTLDLIGESRVMITGADYTMVGIDSGIDGQTHPNTQRNSRHASLYNH